MSDTFCTQKSASRFWLSPTQTPIGGKIFLKCALSTVRGPFMEDIAVCKEEEAERRAGCAFGPGQGTARAWQVYGGDSKPPPVYAGDSKPPADFEQETGRGAFVPGCRFRLHSQPRTRRLDSWECVKKLFDAFNTVEYIFRCSEDV